MEWRLGSIDPSWSTYRQAFWGFGGNAPGKKKFWPVLYIETDFGD